MDSVKKKSCTCTPWGLRVDRDKSDTHQIILRFELEEMEQFKALVCTSKSNILSLPLLAAYLDEHALPADMGKLTLPSLLAQESFVKDPVHPGYYFCSKKGKEAKLIFVTGVPVQARSCEYLLCDRCTCSDRQPSGPRLSHPRSSVGGQGKGAAGKGSKGDHESRHQREAVEPITKEAVKEMILAEKMAEQQGAGEKAKRTREAVSKEPAAKKLKAKKEPAASCKPEGQKPISSFFPPQPKVQDQAATGTFPWDQLAPSPSVKAKSPSAVIGAAPPPFKLVPLIPY